MSTTAPVSLTKTVPGTASGTASAPNIRRPRIESIDLLRGAVMIIMALDHARDYFNNSAYLYDPTDLTKASPALFLTRWITHYCAPIFMLLAGVAACLYGNKNGRKAVSFFLLTRGAWLIFCELFIVSVGWTFNVHYHFYIMQVIWAFGVAMVALSALVHLPRPALLTIAVALIAGHNLLDGIHTTGNDAGAVLWAFLHQFTFFSYPNGFSFVIGYPILPWLGIITLGYYLGSLYAPTVAPHRRKKTLRVLGLGAIAAFILIRAINIYGDPNPWSTQHNALYTILSFLNVTKYPPSLDYILMTLGPGLLFLAATEGPLNKFARTIAIFGRVPFFYYMLHIYIFHALAVIAAMIQGHPASDMTNFTNWVTANPKLQGYGFDLWVVYAVWLLVVIGLYPLCKRFDIYKRANQGQKKWLSYL
jgi:uncharacterized membrane protein